MNSFRFSLTGMLCAIVLLGVALATLRRPSQWWCSAVFTVDLIAVTAALIAALVCRGRIRAAATGFAIGGWTYLLVVFTSLFGAQSASRPQVLTTRLIHAVFPSLESLWQTGSASAAPGMGGGGGGPALPVTIFTFEPLVHTWCTLAVAVAGGIMGGLLFRISCGRESEAR